MKDRSCLQIVAAVFSISAGIAILVFLRLTAFTGEIRIAVGTAESVAVRPVSALWKPGGERIERLPGKEIPFATPANARGWIDENRYYNVAPLPFALAVGDAEVLAERRIEGTVVATAGGDEYPMKAEPDSGMTIGAYQFGVTEIRPWRGLVAAPGNPAMAALTFTRHVPDTSSMPVFVPDNAWVRLGPNTALHFRWVESSEAAQAAVDAGFGDDAPARWGVVDDGQGEWLSSFQPGSGLVMDDGTSVVLVQRVDDFAGPNEATSAIEVLIERDGTSERQWIPANDDMLNSPVRYEDISSVANVVYLLAWEPGVARVKILHGSEPAGDTTLEKGKSWIDDEAGFTIQLEDTLPAATAVRAEESDLYEAVLQAPDRELRVPEHKPVTYDGVEFRFTPKITPARVRYSVATYRPEDAEPKSWQIGPGTVVDVAGWKLRQMLTRHTSQDLAVFQIRKQMTFQNWIVGFLFLAIGAGLLITSWRRFSEGS